MKCATLSFLLNTGWQCKKSFHFKESCTFSEKVSNQKKKTKKGTGVVYEGAVKKKGNRRRGERERESFGFCWIQKAQRRRCCLNKKSIIRAFASCCTQCWMFTEEKNEKKVYSLRDRKMEVRGGSLFPLLHCDSQVRSRRWRVMRVPVGVHVRSVCLTFPKKALFYSMAQWHNPTVWVKINAYYFQIHWYRLCLNVWDCKLEL